MMPSRRHFECPMSALPFDDTLDPAVVACLTGNADEGVYNRFCAAFVRNPDLAIKWDAQEQKIRFKTPVSFIAKVAVDWFNRFQVPPTESDIEEVAVAARLPEKQVGRVLDLLDQSRAIPTVSRAQSNVHLEKLHTRHAHARLMAAIVAADQTADADPIKTVHALLGDLSKATRAQDAGAALFIHELADQQEAFFDPTKTKIDVPFPTWQEEFGGLARQETFNIMGMHSTGKSFLAGELMMHALKSGRRVFLADLEIQLSERYFRILTQLTDIPKKKMLRAPREDYDDEEWDRLQKAKQEWKTNPMFRRFVRAEGASASSCARIAATCRERGFVPDLIVIDHLTLMSPDDTSTRYGGMHEQIGQILKEIKQLSKEFDAAVVLVTHASHSSGDRNQFRVVDDLVETTAALRPGDPPFSKVSADPWVGTPGIVTSFISRNRTGSSGFTTSFLFAPDRAFIQEVPGG